MEICLVGSPMVAATARRHGTARNQAVARDDPQRRLHYPAGRAASRLHNLKELRPGSSGASEVRILFIFDPSRNAVLLVAGDKSGRWQEWYAQAIPMAEAAYEAYLKERR